VERAKAMVDVAIGRLGRQARRQHRPYLTQSERARGVEEVAQRSDREIVADEHENGGLRHHEVLLLLE
jgi:hypothetical protein